MKLHALAGGLLFATALSGFASPAKAQDAALTVFDWPGYEDPALHQAYVDKHGASPTFTFFGDEDEAFEKLRSGFRADIAHPCSTNVVKWREAGILQPLDTSRIAAWNDILPGIRGMKDVMVDADGTAWFLPFDWGNTLLTYRTDTVDAADIRSLKAFADPKFKDKVSIPSNPDAAYALGLLAVGVHDIQAMTDADFDAASAFLREVHKNVRIYWGDNTELAQAMAGGEIDLAWAWNETANALKANGVPVDVMRDTDEGLASWVCGYALLKDAPGNLDKAYDFLNAVMAPSVSSYMVTAWGYGHANGAGMAAVDPAALDAAGHADIDKYRDKTIFAVPVDHNTKMRFVQEFEKIKAGY
ncbi:MAG: extracellular solute-binding protein [Rhizobiaceae bacterium]|nr:extracellular solute-binding protein [Rhizobiaceae bacterium]